jgi:hypothetical protein
MCTYAFPTGPERVPPSRVLRSLYDALMTRYTYERRRTKLECVDYRHPFEDVVFMKGHYVEGSTVPGLWSLQDTLGVKCPECESRNIQEQQA